MCHLSLNTFNEKIIYFLIVNCFKTVNFNREQCGTSVLDPGGLQSQAEEGARFGYTGTVKAWANFSLLQYLFYS